MNKCKECGRPARKDQLNNKGMCMFCQNIALESKMKKIKNSGKIVFGLAGLLLAIREASKFLGKNNNSNNNSGV